MRNAEWGEMLGVYRILDDIDSTSADLIRSQSPVAVLPRGAKLFRLGAMPEAFPFILSGEVNVTRPNHAAQAVVLCRFGPGETCALTTICLIGRQPYPGRGEVVRDARVAMVPSRLFVCVLRQSPAFRAWISGEVAAGVASLMDRVSEVAFTRLDARLAALVVRERERVAKTHQALADELGSTREAVSRTLEDFQRRGLVRLGRGWIELRDRTRLEEMARRSGSRLGRVAGGSARLTA